MRARPCHNRDSERASEDRTSQLYENAKYVITCYTNGEADTLEIPFKLQKNNEP